MYEAELAHAVRLADEADKLSLQYYRSSDLVITTKPDMSPVTTADTAIEARLSEIVTTEYNEGYLGEEGTREAAARTWVVDPIDGTKNYVRKMPIWATLIALRENDQTIVAVVTAPALGRRWWATKGSGAFTTDVDGTTRQLRVSGVSKLEDAFLLTASLGSWSKVPTGRERIDKLIETVWRFRAPGDFLNYMLVAEGAADVTTEPDPKEWDIAAPALIVREAGGNCWTDATAETDAAARRISVTTNGLLEPAVLEALALS